MGTRFRYTQSATVAADGTASIILEPRGHVDLVVRRQTMSCQLPAPVNGSTDPPDQATGLIYVNGLQLEGSYSGNNDASDTYQALTPGEQIECRWSGATPGAVARYTISGDQYPFGRSPARTG